MKNASKSKRSFRGAESNRDSKGQFKKGTHWRPHAMFREKTYLVQEYVAKKRSASDLAADHGITDGAILFWLHKHGIPRRSVSEARAVKRWGLRGSANGMYGRCGSQNPRWIDGSSPLRQTMYARSFWKELARAVYARDNYRCRKCGSPHCKGHPLHAHHVAPWAGNPDSRFELSNIITLCKPCHTWVHSTKNTKHEYLSP
jgi:thymidylate synthase (FAD)